MSEQPLKVWLDRDGKLLRLQLNRPKANIVDAEMIAALDAAFVWARDFSYDYFGYRTLHRSYLLRDPDTDAIVERPQTMLMRVSLGIHCGDLEADVAAANDAERTCFRKSGSYFIDIGLGSQIKDTA